MTLRFRHVDADPGDPVETWPYEAVVVAVERGTVRDWARLTSAVRQDPWGDLARSLEEYLGYAEPSGVTALLDRAITSARHEADAADRAAVAARVRELVALSGLPAGRLARRAGTSGSRLSTYATGKVVPSAAFMRRLERLASSARPGGDAPRSATRPARRTSPSSEPPAPPAVRPSP